MTATKPRTLHAITADLLAVYEAVDDTGELPAGLDDFFAHLENEEARKLDAYCALDDQWAMEEAGAQAQIDQWTAKRDARRNARRRLKDRMLGHLLATGRDKVKTESGRTIAVQENGGKIPVMYLEGQEVPDDFKVWTAVPDTDKVRAVLESGDVLEFAALGERGRHVRIRT
jgi:hypothetical protein